MIQTTIIRIAKQMTKGENCRVLQRLVSSIPKELLKINKKKMNAIKNEKSIFTYHLGKSFFPLLLNFLDFYCLVLMKILCVSKHACSHIAS